jgi:hypothetical protein
MRIPGTKKEIDVRVPTSQSDPRRVALSTAFVLLILLVAFAVAVACVLGMGIDW